jgi:hypothetical protein
MPAYKASRSARLIIIISHDMFPMTSEIRTCQQWVRGLGFKRFPQRPNASTKEAVCPNLIGVLGVTK